MSFFQRLVSDTHAAQQQFQLRNIILRAQQGDVSLALYLNFLEQAYHHVKHTVPLLMACGSRLPVKYQWLQQAVAEYIEEEIGHEQWILNDISAAGGDADAVAASRPHAATELLVSYAYHQIDRGNPLAFFGMVHVLEGTSTQLASAVAEVVQGRLGLPDSAFSYLRSHGALDLEHVKFFESLMNRIEDVTDQADIIHATGLFYGLYGDVLSAAEEGC
ncbi:TenA family transcriptional regulator [Pontibacter sp. JAM-7]|uniref:TenA family transcriptional regulator n=1 Tax=Pontibacter sp. JAM-7 TaxID=3366581 RepID=UPI003AF4DFFB